MARDFNRAAGDNLVVDAAPATAVPLTLACWAQFSGGTTAPHTLVFVGDASATDQYFTLEAKGDVVGDPIRAQARSGGGAAADTSTAFVNDIQHHCCAVFTSSISRACFIDGGSKGTDTTSSTPTGVDRMAIGRAMDSSASDTISGRIAEVGIWNAALTDAEVAILALGFSPPFVRPQSLIGYWPLIGRTSPEIDLVGGNDMAVTGATAFAHPGIIYPTPSRAIFVPAVVSGRIMSSIAASGGLAGHGGIAGPGGGLAG